MGFLKWLRRLMRFVPPWDTAPQEPRILEVFLDGHWQPVQVVGCSGLLLQVSQRDSRTGRLTLMHIHRHECRDKEVFDYFFNLYLSQTGEELFWESGEKYTGSD